VSVSADEFLFPRFTYYLDKSDPDIVILRRSDDSFVAAFSARGVTRATITSSAARAQVGSRAMTSSTPATAKTSGAR
jgi:hypothetical protein